MTELMRGQDQQQRDGVRQAVLQNRWIAEHLKKHYEVMFQIEGRQVVGEIESEAGTERGGGEGSQNKQQNVEPQTPAPHGWSGFR
ncbi:MAG: hypothetical protein QM757_14190 [Paludibaculum sp.]